MSRLEPTFLVLGAGRCGTTGLAQGLTTHPGVFVTAPKEPHYFALHDTTATFAGPGDDATISRVAVTDRESYLALYPEADSGYVALGDASVTSLMCPDAAIPEIKEVCPDARLVVLLREPVARAYSAFGYMHVRGFEPCEDFLDAVADEDRRVAENWQHLWHYTRMSTYAPALSAFQEAFGREQVGVWFYDDLERDYVSTVKEVLRFIGTAPSPGEAEGVPRVNASGTPRSALLQRGIQTLTRNELARSSIKRLTSYRAREAVRRRLLRRPEMDSGHATLAPRFTEDLLALQDLVDMDRAPQWLKDPR